MVDIGLLLSLPTDSIAVRVAVASVVAVIAGRMLLRAGLRSPHVRAFVALLPVLAVAAVAIGYARSPSLPSVWHTVDAAGGLSIPVGDTYITFAPATVPLLLSVYGVIVAVRLGLRAHRARGARRRLRAIAAAGEAPPAAVSALVARLAAALRTPGPDVLLVPDLRGGAAVIGVRRPVLLVDRDLVRRLDHSELEGVLAHELAHVVRRDNLVVAALGVVRDLVFFVPAGSWSLQRLLREREHAADMTAVAVTGRPGALAGGLLKVLEAARGPGVVACAPLLAEGTLVARVEELCDERDPPSRARRHAELGVAALALSGAVAAAVFAPGTVAGQERQRDALGVLFSGVNTGDEGTDVTARSAVFTAFDEAGTRASATAGGTPDPVQSVASAVLPPDDPEALTPTRLAACEQVTGACHDQHVERRLRLVPDQVQRVDSDLVDRWRLDPVVRSGDGQLGVFWMQRQQAR